MDSFGEQVEPITHFLTGACLARLGFNRKTALATLTMTLAAEAPDIDIVAYVKGSVSGFVCHRGATHTLWGIPLVAAAGARRGLRWIPLVATASARMDAPDKIASASRTHRDAERLTPRWGLLYLFACVAGYSHLLTGLHQQLRCATPVAVVAEVVCVGHRLHHRAAAAAVSDRRPRLAVLVRAGQSGDRRTRNLPARQSGRAVALILMVLLWGVRDYEHRRAVNAMEAL